MQLYQVISVRLVILGLVYLVQDIKVSMFRLVKIILMLASLTHAAHVIQFVLSQVINWMLNVLQGSFLLIKTIKFFPLCIAWFPDFCSYFCGLALTWVEVQ